MKKYFVILLSLVFALGTVGIAVADDGGMDSVRASKPGAKVIIGGDARVRGIWFKNDDFDDTGAENDNRYYDQRIRIKVDGEAGNGFGAHLRLAAGNERWDGTANTASGSNIDVDYAYITVPISTVKVNAGAKKKYFGHGFMDNQFDDRYDVLEVMGTFESVKVTAFTNKVDETFDGVTGDNNLKDFNDYGVTLVANMNDIEAGANIVYHHDNRQTVVGTDNDKGTDVGIYAKANVQGIGVGGEIVFLAGDLNKDSADNTPWGLMAYANTTVGAVGVRLDVAFVANGFEADNNYEPVLSLGQNQQTALADFGTDDDAKAWIIAASANTDVMENVNILGRVGYASFEDPGVGDDPNIFELDGEVLVQLAKNARYIIEAAYVNGSDEIGPDAAIILANRAEIYF